MNFLNELQQRNRALYGYGWLNFLAALVCGVLIFTTDTKVLGISAWIKPLKFYLSIGAFVWTMGWLLHYLRAPGKERAYTVMALMVLPFESVVITWQAAHGRLSHFNTDTVLYSILFSLMGMAISVLTAWTGYIGYLFFKKKDIGLPAAYLLGIRLGIVFFVLFAFEGGMMARALQHTVGAPDGGPGLPVVNWSRRHGDLRIAHFFGMHTLQLFPLFGYFVARNPRTVLLFAGGYVAVVALLLVRALMGLPLF